VDVKKLLAEKQATYEALVRQIQQLDAQRKLLVEEALRLEGEIRVLKQLAEGEAKGE